jgi:hypothetical protein|tara:strand:- start:2313 stop:2423 length:111 start_codon:yes stop_codon:yes gene_type:complete
MKKSKWKVVGYYFDGKQAYTLLQDESGKTKTIKGVQ